MPGDRLPIWGRVSLLTSYAGAPGVFPDSFSSGPWAGPRCNSTRLRPTPRVTERSAVEFIAASNKLYALSTLRKHAMRRKREGLGRVNRVVRSRFLLQRHDSRIVQQRSEC